MSFEYISDFWGRYKGKKSNRFTTVEKDALQLMAAFIHGNINNQEFAEQFGIVTNRFKELTTIDGQSVIDEETPLWLNSFIGLHFVTWKKVQEVERYFEEHPDELTDDRKLRLDIIREQGLTKGLKDICRTTIEKLSFD